jgi:hypothetical protein
VNAKRAPKARKLGSIGYCTTHQKGLYENKKQAKAAIREACEKGMRAYRCDVADGFWHIGHLPHVIREGRMTQREVYGR